MVELLTHSGAHFERWRRADIIDRKDCWLVLTERLAIVYGGR